MKAVFLKTMIISISVFTNKAEAQNRSLGMNTRLLSHKLSVEPSPVKKWDIKNVAYPLLRKVTFFKYLKGGATGLDRRLQNGDLLVRKIKRTK